MNIGVIKETKTDETRVALQPFQVKVLIANGHKIYVENNAGVLAGFPDDEYVVNGAEIKDKKYILDKCKLILKIKAPLDNEYNDYTKDHIIFTYLHFDENILPDKIRELIKSGFMGIAYEWVEESGRYPLLEPMSKLTGYLFAQKAVEFCTKYKGIICGKHEDYLKGANVLIIGLGTIGLSSLKFCMDNNLKISVLDKNLATVNIRINERFKTNKIDYIEKYSIELISFNNSDPLKTKAELEKTINKYDIILNCAVRRPDMPKDKLEYLIDRQMIQTMEPYSVICDTTACDNDLIETCVSSEEVDKIDIINDVVHYSCDHLPSIVGKSATELLTSQTFPFILEIANKGISEAVKSNKALYRGVVCYKNKITHRYIAEKKGFQFYKLSDLV
ncbi:MAG: hypothetical protein B6D61_10365 [Bacteroidetes bacterium 4484_249]|nr:MAG: hypothetical protein B6D61_10365 [Bacteroidetes bacterium 4484_249]